MSSANIIWLIIVAALYGLTIWFVLRKAKAQHFTTTINTLVVVATTIAFPLAYYGLYVVLWNLWFVAK